MSLPASARTELARLTLVACDAAYAGDRTATGSPLAPYFDGDRTSVPFVWRSGFNAQFTRADDTSGFKIVIYQNANELVVAFAGTDGASPVDWSANAFHLGVNQWERNKAAVLDEITRLSNPSTKVHLTGQSLGGALAQFAAHDLLKDPRFQGSATLTTFNALGAIAGLRERAGYDATLANRLSEAAHYRITNDIVSRLGEGHFGGTVYEFDFPDLNRFDQDGKRPYLNLVVAHRIESGFYANLGTIQSDFDRARPLAPAEVGYLQIGSLQKLASKWGNPLSQFDTNPLTATLALIGSLGPAAANAPEAEVNEAARAFYEHKYRAGEISRSLWERAQRMDFATAAKRIYAAQPGVFYGSLALSQLIDAMVRIGGGQFNPIKQFLDQRLPIPLAPLPIRPEPQAEAQWGVMERFLHGIGYMSSPLIQNTVSPHQLSETLTSGPDWIAATKDYIAQATRASGANLVALNTALTDVLWEVASENSGLGAAYADYADGITAVLNGVVVADAMQIAKANPDYIGSALAAGDSGLFGTISDYAAYDPVRDAVERALANPQYEQLHDGLQEALEVVETAGQRSVIRGGHGSNPFDDAAFAGENDVAIVANNEGSVSVLSLYLPYRAAENGQRVRLTLGGAAAGRFEVLHDGTSTGIDANGAFTLVVPEGERKLVFAVRVDDDVDTDETLTLTAQLLDTNDAVSHRSHLELSLTLDATVEPTTNPTNLRTGTSVDDNRNGDATHRPVVGTTGADRLQALAGRDEAFGLAGDDLIEAGPGSDLANGDDGADRVFADAVLTDAALRTYIDTTAAIIDNTDPATVQPVESGDWLSGGLGDDTVVGAATPDILFGGGGRDRIVGGAGHDIIDGDDDYEPGMRSQTSALTGVTVTRNYKNNPHELYFSSAHIYNNAVDVGAGDEIHAGAGDDIVTAQYGDDTVFGDNGDDVIAGDSGNDSLFGGAGADRIAGDWYGTNDVLEPSGDDYIDGGDGGDILNGEGGADVLIGGAGNDRLRGHIDVTFAQAPNEEEALDGSDYLSGGAGGDSLVGDAFDDTLLGGDDDDQLFGDSDQTVEALHGGDYLDGGAGNDYLRGYGGNDEMLGGDGNDTLHAEAGDDLLDGGADDDVLFGMDGNDTLNGGFGDDQLVGGAGNDRISGGAWGDDVIWGEDGDDNVDGDVGNDYIDAGAGNDTIIAGSGENIVYGRSGDDVLHGGEHFDQIVGGDGRDTASGGEGDDFVWGEADDDTLAGDAGDDQLRGGDGTDVLDGGDGRDALFGEAGDDTLNGGAGRDYLLGGAGNDVYLVDGLSNEDIIIDDEGQNTVRFSDEVLRDELRFRRGVDDQGNDRYLVIEGGGTFARLIVRNGIDGAVGRFEFSDGSAMTHADAMAQLAAQALPNAKPVAGVQPTTVYGTTGNDRIVALPGGATIFAGSGDDDVTGAAGNDALDGGEGIDRLDGGPGADVLTGGKGTDTYVFGRDRGRDTIVEQFLDAAGASELDTLDLAQGVAPADLTLHRDGFDLVVAINQTAAQLRVRSHFMAQVSALDPVTGQPKLVPADHRIERIRFADGTVWDAAAIASRTVTGTPNAMTGGSGNDTHVVDDAGDTVSEAAAGGDDLIRSSVTYAMRPNVERLTLTGFVDANAWSTPGNAVSYLTGNAGNNVFNGPGTFYNASGSTTTTTTGGGIMGYAVMSGGAGDDTYHMTGTVGGQVIEASGEGYDTVVLHGLDWNYYLLPDNVEAVRSHEGTIVQTSVTRWRVGNALDNYIEGSQGQSFMPGAFVNHLDGGLGADTMIGSPGNDLFIVDNAGDRVLDTGVFLGGGQMSTGDEIEASVAYELPDNIEILHLTGSNAIDGWGNDLANILDGTRNPASNRLAGGLGNDRYQVTANDVVIERPGEGVDTLELTGTGERVYTAAELRANVEVLAFGEDLGNAGYAGDDRSERVEGNVWHNTLRGGGGDDELLGGDGDDQLEGGPGNDSLNAGQGNDIYLFSRGFGEDQVWGDGNLEIQFDATIPLADLVFSANSIAVAGTEDRIRFGGVTGIRMHFADGTHLTEREVFARFEASKSTTPTAGGDMLTGTAADDSFDALAGDDFLYGQAGNDTLLGGADNDELHGGDGNDAVRGNAGSDKLYGDAGDDTLGGGDDNDRIEGGPGRDTIDGEAGDDFLYGNADADLLSGGVGDDSLYGADGDDDVSGNAGYDSLYGEAGNDRLIGGDGGDILVGGTGSDRLQGGAGGDALSGGEGIDTYVFESGGEMDYVDEWGSLPDELSIVEVDAAFAPEDIVLSRIDDYAGPEVHITANGGADILVLRGFGGADRPLEIRFSDGTVWTPAMVRDLLGRQDGTDLDDALSGSAFDDAMYGYAGNDTLTAFAGNDLLDGGTGTDWLEGGEGDDRYVVDTAADTLYELPYEGIDSVESDVSLTLPANIENLMLLGSALSGIGNAENNRIVGNALANVLDGKLGGDQLIGGAGNDSYVVDALSDTVLENANEGVDSVSASVTYTLAADVEHLTLTGSAAISGTGNALANSLRGNAAANTLTGLDGNDALDGGAGADQLRGGNGDDTYTVDRATDVITELAGGGLDRVTASATYTLSAEVEHLTLSGSAAINGTGNALANQITGNAAANVLDGKAGADTLRGGAGNDGYVVDSASDVLIENAAEGTDTVSSSISWTLATNFENLTLTGTAAINGTGNAVVNTIQGNAAANVLDGKAGADTLRGGAGNDTYVVDSGDVVVENLNEGTDVVQSTLAYTLGANVENLTLTGTAAINGTGNTLANTLVGNAAANTLNGAAGNDTMRGGAGDDVYVVDATADIVIENAAEGIDTVQTAATFTLSANVENLTLTGTAAISGTGNTLANVLQGNAAGNALDGGAGADTLRGGAGNDTLTVDNAADVVVENASEGDDTVRSYLSWTLGSNLENLTLVGTAAINATGNTLNNWLQGNSAINSMVGGDGQDLIFGDLGNDSLAGGNGRDLLQGGDGADTVTDTAGNGLLHGGAGADVLNAGAGNEILIGGAANDTLTLGAGADIIAFNRGDGQDVVNASTVADNTLSLGGGIRYADVALRKSGSDLVIEVGATEQMTLKDWYLTTANKHVVNLQMIVDASTDWNATSADPLYNKRVARFDFAGLVARFDAALAANPTLTRWSVGAALADFRTSGSDTSALGGDLGYQYGHANSLAGIGWTPADTVLASALFGTAMQTLQASSTLFSGTKTLR